MTTVVVFGGTGFLGRRLVHRLAAAGVVVHVAVRHPEGALSALPAADLAQITFFRADVCDKTSIAAAMARADAVVNAVSAYVEKGGVSFEAVHVQGAETVAREAVRLGVARLVLISGSAPIHSRGHLTFVPVDVANWQSSRRFQMLPSSARVPYSVLATRCSAHSPTSPGCSRYCR